MDIESQDRELTIAMRRVLAFAKEQMPESIVCIMTFTHAEEVPGMALNKIATNSMDRETLREEINKIADNFVNAGVVDLTNTQGGMQ